MEIVNQEVTNEEDANIKRTDKKKLILKTLFLLSPAIFYGVYFIVFSIVLAAQTGLLDLSILPVIFLGVPFIPILILTTVNTVLYFKKPNMKLVLLILNFVEIAVFLGLGLWMGSVSFSTYSGTAFIPLFIVPTVITLLLKAVVIFFTAKTLQLFKK